jgi:hypothetical protein
MIVSKITEKKVLRTDGVRVRCFSVQCAMQVTVELPLTSCFFRQSVDLSELAAWVVGEVVIPNIHQEL